MPKAHKDPGEATAEGKWVLMAREQWGDVEPIEGPVAMLVEFLMPIPKSMPKKFHRLVGEGGLAWHEKKPDWDNCLKFVKDCLNGLAWKDDNQVVMVFGWKRYSLSPMTLVHIVSAYDLGAIADMVHRAELMTMRQEHSVGGKTEQGGLFG